LHSHIKSALLGACSLAFVATGAAAENFNIPSGELNGALDAYIKQAGITLMYLPSAVKGIHSNGVAGNLSADRALSKILAGTGFAMRRTASGAIGIYRDQSSDADSPATVQFAEAVPVSKATLETVTVTSSKLGGADVQSIPIAITALSQEQLTATQTTGGPDLVKQVPNLTFSKTNFTGYNIQIRGIGTQAISVTTDPAVAVALNDIPFIRNHFFEQEFYDLGQAEVLRGPQGTLYGRNATAGVVNLITAKPTDQFEAMASGELGNYHQRRFEGMINLPIVDDRVDIRIAGEWTKRQGYSFNSLTDQRIDGRDLWSGRVTLAFSPTENLKTTFVWEHFSEDDDRMRTAKQLCKTAVPPASINGLPVQPGLLDRGGALNIGGGDFLSQGCEATSLYSPDAFEVPYGFSLPYAIALGDAGGANIGIDPYASTTQSRNLRVIETQLEPHYHAKNDVLELNGEYAVTPSLTVTSQTGYSQDFLSSTEDYNRFDTSPGIFTYVNGDTTFSDEGRIIPDPAAGTGSIPQNSVLFCDPQLGCSDRIVAEDLSNERAWQFSQELRLSSNFSGPLNFSFGANLLHYETEENYYVFINALSYYASVNNIGNTGGSIDNSDCLQHNAFTGGFQNPNPKIGGGEPETGCVYLDPNPLSSLNNYGHNYFLSQNPYTLNSYASFGEVYYAVTSDLKATGGLRWTEDRKRFTDIPSEVVNWGYGYPVTAIVDQQWDELTGRAALNWTPKLNFTDQTLVYGSYSRGYKAGGANPPGAVLGGGAGGPTIAEPVHPLTFKPEFINAFEMGTKNTLLDGTFTLNGDIFYYDYKGYQISEIVDRTSINLNFDAKVKGAELEAKWEPLPGLQFNFAGGYEDTRVDNGQAAVDLMDRTDAAHHPDWIVVKPWVTQASNCILPLYVLHAIMEEDGETPSNNLNAYTCNIAYVQNLDPATLQPYIAGPTGNGGGLGSNTFAIPTDYIGFDPTNPAINNGEGFAKPLGGNRLPNAPPFTISFGAQYSVPITPNWAGTIRGDYYWQDYSWARIFNDDPYDRIRGYTNLNLTLIFTNQNGWQVMLYDKNVFNETAITGDFLNSDDSGLTTNVFLTDPKLIGIRVTKNW